MNKVNENKDVNIKGLDRISEKRKDLEFTLERTKFAYPQEKIVFLVEVCINILQEFSQGVISLQ